MTSQIKITDLLNKKLQCPKCKKWTAKLKKRGYVYDLICADCGYSKAVIGDVSK